MSHHFGSIGALEFCHYVGCNVFLVKINHEKLCHNGETFVVFETATLFHTQQHTVKQILDKHVFLCIYTCACDIWPSLKLHDLISDIFLPFSK